MEKQDYSNANGVLESFQDKLDMQPVNSKITVTEEVNYVKLLEEGEKKQLKAPDKG